MTVLTPAPAMTTTQPALTLEEFFKQFRAINPFVKDRVVQPAMETELDADAVHQTQFRQLLMLARTARDQHSGIGAVLWGEAGVGKSHLLSRLARWAYDGGQACFVYLQNLQPGPENLPRCLLRVTVSILTQGRQDQFHETPLYRLVQAAVQTALQENPLALEPEQAYARLLDRLNAQAPAQPAFVDRTIYHVLFRFLHSAAPGRTTPDDGTAALAVRWLYGDALDQDEARQLGLVVQSNTDDGVALADNQQIKLVLVALSQMALFAQQPLLLCFDQVENLEPAQVSMLTRFVQAILDSAPNLLVVTCGVKDTLLDWKTIGAIPSAAWDRVAQFEIDLPRVTPHEGRQIVEMRLDHFLTPYLELEAVKNRVQEAPLFPLAGTWFDEFLKDKADLRPRQVIKWARDGWTLEQQALEKLGGKAWLGGKPLPPSKEPQSQPQLSLADLIDEKVAAKMAEQIAQRQGDPETLPPDADNLAGLTATLLRQCLGGAATYPLRSVRQPKAPSLRQRPTYSVVVEQEVDTGLISVGVLCLTTGNATSTAAFALRRLLEDRQPPAQLLLLTDCRRPLRLGPKGHEYLGQLQRNYGERFQHVELTFDQYAELDALKATGGMALSKDLEIDLPGGEIRPVSEAEVIASHHRRKRYAAHVLLQPLLGLQRVVPVPDPEIGPPPDKMPESDPQDVREFIVAQLALALGASSYELSIRYVAYLKATKHPPLEQAACKRLIEDVARALHDEGLVNVTPTADGIFVMSRRR